MINNCKCHKFLSAATPYQYHQCMRIVGGFLCQLLELMVLLPGGQTSCLTSVYLLSSGAQLLPPYFGSGSLQLRALMIAQTLLPLSTWTHWPLLSFWKAVQLPLTVKCEKIVKIDKGNKIKFKIAPPPQGGEQQLYLETFSSTASHKNCKYT